MKNNLLNLNVWQPSRSQLHDTILMFVDIFKDDHFYKILFREDDQFKKSLYLYFEIMIDIAMRSNQVFVVGDYYGGAIFFSPTEKHISFIEQILNLPRGVKIFSLRKLISSLMVCNDIISEMPKNPCYYLFLVGRKPDSFLDHQGVATAAVMPTLKLCDQLKIPCYSEFTSVNSRNWAESLGFKVTKVKKLLYYKDTEIYLSLREPKRD